MTVKEKTGVDASDPKNTAGEGADGAAGQGSNDRTVPLSVLEATRNDLKGQLARALKEVDSLKAGQQNQSEKPEKTEKHYTRAELRAAVNNGAITEDQMDAIIEAQTEKRITQKAEVTANSVVKQSAAVGKITADIEQYTASFPDLLDESSDTRKKVQREFDYLVGLGDDPQSLATELKAVRAALGPMGARGRKKSPESLEDGGGSGEDNHRPGSESGWAKGLTPRQKTHYESLINKGLYKGHSDPRLAKELAGIRARGKAH